ncbi:phage tail assembly protein [Pseudomonas lactis]|uniref:phage tail assembly protein n=1 Tax=Pseudomonas lactis TaxID=1615674 RepID=UPI0019096B15|nr:phage tail assembly protein [Pseudomonas lactis]MBK3440651.1 phage tail assembly protein [Pseudomonas lactis]
MTDVSMASPLPAWLSLTAEGVTVTLVHKANFNGVVLDKLTMRAPSVKDVMGAKAAGGGDYEKMELNMFCSLLEATEAELLSLKYKDYKRLSVGYFRLVEEDDM